MKNFAVLRVAKGKGSPNGLIAHIDRTGSKELAKDSYPHADPTKYHLNKEYTGNHGRSGEECIAEIMDKKCTSKRKIREDMVRYCNGVISASPEIMEKIQADGRLDEWVQSNISWLYKTYGKDNFFRITLHLDEKTPHLQFMFVPITPGGNLSAKTMLGGRASLSQLQTNYALAMKDFGIVRGELNSKAEHEKYKKYHENIKKTMKIIEDNPTVEQLEVAICKLSEEKTQNEFSYKHQINDLEQKLRTKTKKDNEMTERAKKVSQIKENTHCFDFFQHLCNLGLVEFEKKEGNNMIFKKIGQNSGSIAVRMKENKWIDFSGGRQSDIFDACKQFLNLDFNKSIEYLEVLKNVEYEPIKLIEPSISQHTPIEVVAEFERPNNEILLNYAADRGINRDTLNESAVTELHYSFDTIENNEIKTNNFFGLALKNINNGYSLRNPRIKQTIGNQGISLAETPTNPKKTLYIVEGMFDYLTLLQLQFKGVYMILNSTSNLKNINHQEFADIFKDYRISIAMNWDKAGRQATEKLENIFKELKPIDFTEFIGGIVGLNGDIWDFNSKIKNLWNWRKEQLQIPPQNPNLRVRR